TVILPIILHLLTILPASAILDINENTLSDIWELDVNNQSLLPHVDPANPPATAAADPDGDGQTNCEEAAAGTDPGNPKSSRRTLPSRIPLRSGNIHDR
ncbi:MAG: hypothetical protein K9N23_17160, partial [Akkermansiaceae bacterium]|nr:hypothetical protein [Akkermansiaceae bacterium]